MENNFCYLPRAVEEEVWGVSATSVGHVRIEPASSYPPPGHPDDHAFDVERGRVLETYVMVLISEGRGTFECATVRRKFRIEAGSVFWLYPGIWHRYCPDPETGWVEHWIECQGAAFETAQRRGMIRPDHPVQAADTTDAVAQIFAKIHAVAFDSDALENQHILSTLGLHLMALLVQQADAIRSNPDEKFVQRAKMLILERCDQALSMPEIARQMKVSYSRFRQAFTAEVGLSPKQYHLEMRLARARDLLANSDRSLKEIAARLGFHSAFHFSNQFSRIHEVSPTTWRAEWTRRHRA